MPTYADSHLLPPTSSLPTIPELFDRIADANPNYIAVATVRAVERGIQGSYMETSTFGEIQAASRRAAYLFTAPEYGICLKKG
jgi:hypothetical protein